MTDVIEQTETGKWAKDNPSVTAILRYLKKKREISAEMVVEWDAQHGKTLLTWDNREAAELYRLYQARLFLNTFRAIRGRMIVRAFINVPGEDDDADRDRAYFNAEDVSREPAIRARVIEGLTGRMVNLAAQLRFWKLQDPERESVLREIAAVWK